MTINWDDYNPYVPPYRGLVSELPRRQARESFKHLMDAKSGRIEQLRSLLKANGIILGEDDEAIQHLDDWFREHVEPNPEQRDRLRNLWYAVTTDIGLFLGEVLIRRGLGLYWEFFTGGGKRDVAYQRPVIMGFSKTVDPKYNIDPAFIVARHGHGVITSAQVDPRLFLRILKNSELA